MMLIFRMAQTYFVVDPPCGRFLPLRGKTSRSEIHEPLYIYQPQKWAEVAGIYHRDVKLENLMFRGRTSGAMSGRKVSGGGIVFLVVTPTFSSTEPFHPDELWEIIGKSVACGVKSSLFGAPFDE